MQKPRLSFWQIWNMSFGFLGIQFGWGLQLANMSPIYKYLHAEESSLPYLWLAGPITGLRRELEPLRSGALINLYVSEQQYAYARSSRGNVVLVVFNNDDKAADFQFDVSQLGFRNGAVLRDRIENNRDVTVRDGKVRVNLPKRSAALFAGR